jgi:hypothetical protein
MTIALCSNILFINNLKFRLQEDKVFLFPREVKKMKIIFITLLYVLVTYNSNYLYKVESLFINLIAICTLQ